LPTAAWSAFRPATDEGGGWVATHEDITERQQLEKQRDDMLAQENRRLLTESAIFIVPRAVEEVLGWSATAPTP